MVTVKQHLDRLGGVVAVATELGLPISTVSGWGLSNSIPHWREPALRELTKAKGFKFPKRFADKQDAAA